MYIPLSGIQDHAPPRAKIFPNAQNSILGIVSGDSYSLHRTQPPAALKQQSLVKGSFRCAVPLGTSNITLIVGAPPVPMFAPNKLVLWDEEHDAVVATVELHDQILAVLADPSCTYVTAVLQNSVVILHLFSDDHSFLSIRHVGSFPTCANPRGLAAVAMDNGILKVVALGRLKGQYQTIAISNGRVHISSIVIAHTSSLAALAVSPCGRIVATASKKGTIVRVWSFANSRRLRELRRGSESASIFSLSFRPDSQAIALTSSRGTLHIWNLVDPKFPPPSGSLLPRISYFDSERSHAYFRFPHHDIWSAANRSVSLSNMFFLALWVNHSSLVLLTDTGDHFLLSSPPNGGLCSIASYTNILTSDDA